MHASAPEKAPASSSVMYITYLSISWALPDLAINRSTLSMLIDYGD